MGPPGIFLSVLIPTIARRRDKLAELLAALLPQAEAGGAEVIALRNNGEHPLPVLRQALLDEAAGVFACFVDDDDLVAPTYVADITAALAGNPAADSAGFLLERSWDTRIPVRMEQDMSGPRQDRQAWAPRGARMLVPPSEAVVLHRNGLATPMGGGVSDDERYGLTEISRRNHGWGDETCDWSILCPTRTAVLRECSFLGFAGSVKEDRYFRDQVIGKLTGPEVFIPKVLYRYRWDLADTVQGDLPPHVPLPPLEVLSPAFRYCEGRDLAPVPNA